MVNILCQPIWVPGSWSKLCLGVSVGFTSELDDWGKQKAWVGLVQSIEGGPKQSRSWREGEPVLFCPTAELDPARLPKIKTDPIGSLFSGLWTRTD